MANRRNLLRWLTIYYFSGGFICIMEVLENLFSWFFFIALILTIIFGIMWFRNRKDKEDSKYAKNKNIH